MKNGSSPIKSGNRYLFSASLNNGYKTKMFRFFTQWIVLITLVILTTGCVAPGLGLYQKALMDRQAAYQRALNQREAYQKSIQQAAIQQQLARQGAGNQQITNRDSISVPEPTPTPTTASLSPAQLAKQSMMSDTLIGQACNNNFNFEIKITEGRVAGREDGPFTLIFIAKLTSKPQSSLQFQTLLEGTVDNQLGILRFHAYKDPSEHKGLLDLVRGKGPGLFSDLILNLVKSTNGKGWEGTIEGKKFSACDDLYLASEMGNDISMFPSLKKRYARYLIFSEDLAGPVVQLYWLKRAASLDEDQIYFLARKYEELGQASPENYAFALRHYHDAAESQGNVGAYYGLYRMYSSGLGTKVDVSKSKKWLKLAEAEYRSATNVCISSEVIEAFKSRWAQIESMNQAMSAISNNLLGTNSDIGQIVIRKIEAGNLMTLNKPFSCYATIQRVGAHFDMGTPSYYVTTDANGRVYAYDNAHNKLASDLTSIAADSLARMVSHKSEIKVYPVGNNHYEIRDELNGKVQREFAPSHQKK